MRESLVINGVGVEYWGKWTYGLDFCFFNLNVGLENFGAFFGFGGIGKFW